MCLQNKHVSPNKQLAKLKQHLLILCRNSGPGDIQQNITDFPFCYKQAYLNAETPVATTHISLADNIMMR